MDSLHILVGSAVSIGFLHTIIGVDHSLPFIVLGRAQSWTLRKTLFVTLLCGVGHVLSSVLLGGIGIGLGVAAAKLQWIESWRGGVAAWSLIIFGLAYAGWSLARQRRRQRGAHAHGHRVHSHEQRIEGEHRHEGLSPTALTAWTLFIIFVLGPCEPLIPLLMVPALSLGAWAAVPVASAFGLTTIGTMMLVVTIGYFGVTLPFFQRLEAHAHTLAGLAIAASGLAIQLLGI